MIPRSTAIAGRPSMTTTTGKWTQGACIVGVRRACIFIRPIAAGRDAGALCTVPEPRKDFDGSRRRARAEGAASLCRRWAMAPPSIPGAVRTNAAGQKGACGSPATGLAATFPGSTQATEATQAGPEQPRYGAHPSASAHACGVIKRSWRLGGCHREVTEALLPSRHGSSCARPGQKYIFFVNIYETLEGERWPSAGSTTRQYPRNQW